MHRQLRSFDRWIISRDWCVILPVIFVSVATTINKVHTGHDVGNSGLFLVDVVHSRDSFEYSDGRFAFLVVILHFVLGQVMQRIEFANFVFVDLVVVGGSGLFAQRFSTSYQMVAETVSSNLMRRIVGTLFKLFVPFLDSVATSWTGHGCK